MYFFLPKKVSDYDCDCSNHLKISAVMKYMQQTSSQQLAHMGFSVEKLMQEKMVFLLSKISIQIHRMPVCNEEIVVGTAPTQPRGARFVREFVVESPKGERLVSALSLWILVHPDTRKILRPSFFPYDMQFQPPALQEIMEDVSLEKQSTSSSVCTQISVQYSHIDINQHVNNAVYADFVCDTLPYQKVISRGIRTLILSFQKEAKQNDLLTLCRQQQGDGVYHITGQHSGKACFEAAVILG